MTEQELQTLLRLKRHEQPPPGYYDDLLAAVHRRQRTDLLQRPLWRIALERVQAFVSAQSAGPVAYGGAFAALIIAGVMTIDAFTPEAGSQGGALVAATRPSEGPKREFSLKLQPGQGTQSLAAERQLVAAPTPLTLTHMPRYVIDARPASYDSLFSF